MNNTNPNQNKTAVLFALVRHPNKTEDNKTDRAE